MSKGVRRKPTKIGLLAADGSRIEIDKLRRPDGSWFPRPEPIGIDSLSSRIASLERRRRPVRGMTEHYVGVRAAPGVVGQPPRAG